MIIKLMRNEGTVRNEYSIESGGGGHQPWCNVMSPPPIERFEILCFKRSKSEIFFSQLYNGLPHELQKSPPPSEKCPNSTLRKDPTPVR